MADSYVDPTTKDNPTTGLDIDADWGDCVNADLAFLRNPPCAKARRTSSQSIATGTDDYVDFELAEFDNGADYGGAFWSSGANADRLTVPTATVGSNAGVYLVQAYTYWDTDTSATESHYRQAVIELNGSTILGALTGSALYAFGRLTVSALADLSEGDYVKLEVHQTLGSASDVEDAWLSLTWMGT